MKKLLLVLLLCTGLAAGLLYATTGATYPALQEGDLIFQTTTSNQSTAILLATASIYTHVGIVTKNGNEFAVIEASKSVKETSLEEWTNRGVLKRVAVYRNQSLTPEQATRITSLAKSYYGKPYDIFFSLKDDAFYCSELPYLTYGKAGIQIGKVQKISELNFDNPPVKKLIEKRWQRHPECKAQNYTFEECYEHILNQDIVTPASIARDTQFVEIYSNYPL